MALITLDQILAPLRYDTGSGILTVSGSLNVQQINPATSSYALTVSGSFNLVDATNVASGTYNGNPMDGGSY
jgi:hypothetical protein